ncbi:MAG: hypothetical protein ACRCUT_02345 [Spirochaetota bacterium]
MDFDGIIKQNLQKMADEFELRKSYYLINLHAGIDILMRNAPEWFGGEIPEQFTAALNSLMNLSVVYYDQSRDFTDFAFENDQAVIDPVDMISGIIGDLRLLMPAVDISVEGESGCCVFTSPQILKDSLSNAVFCFMQFAGDTTRIKFSVTRRMSSIKIVVDATGLNEEIPDISRILRTIYTHHTGSEYRFRMGIEIPVSDLKKIGGITHLDIHNDNRDISFSISFPSYDFIRTVEDIRRQMADENAPHYSGDIVLSVHDPLLELVLKENLGELGYTVKSYTQERLRFVPEDSYLALIIDYDMIRNGYICAADFSPSVSKGKAIVITGADSGELQQSSVFFYLPMPFDVDSIVEHIERMR